MARVSIDADLVVQNGGNRFAIESSGRSIEVRASARAMMALRRIWLDLAKSFPLQALVAKTSESAIQPVHWRWGPLRLALLGPDGPTRLARLLGAR